MIAEQAWELVDKRKTVTRCIVFCDRREDAAKAKRVIDQRARGDKKKGVAPVDIETELFVGAA